MTKRKRRKRLTSEEILAGPRGITIRYGRADSEGREHADFIPPERDALVVFKDQFGTVHAAGMGDVDITDPRVEKIVDRVVRKLGLYDAPVEE